MDKGSEEKPKENQTPAKDNWSKKYINFFEKHPALLLLIPTFLGGIWQLFALWGIGISYLRFFSVSQLISDGLIVLIYLTLMSLFIGVGRFMIIQLKQHPIFEPGFRLIAKISLYLFSYYFLSKIAFIGLKWGLLQVNIKPSEETRLNIFLATLLLFSIFTNFHHNLYTSLVSFLKNKILSLKKKAIKRIILSILKVVKKSYGLVYFLPLMACAVWIGVVIDSLVGIGKHAIPHNLVNISQIERVVERDYKMEPKDYKISYFNDKYIFIEYNHTPKEVVEKLRKERKYIPNKVIILKTDVLFEDSTLNNN